jgi:zinc/manganese transport system ATP-binding protein
MTNNSIDFDPVMPPSTETHKGLVSQNVIEFEHAEVRRGKRIVWSDVQLSVKSGEFIAILGPNGSGKSTLLKAILGLLPLSKGRINILGKAVRRGNPAISYLPQRRSFGPDMHVQGRELVRLGLEGTRWGVPLPGLRRLWGGGRLANVERQRVKQAIEMVGATAYANRPIGTLSGGEQQRLLIAQALVTRPRIFLLDEPLESLDLHNQQAVSALIRSISQEYQITVMLVAHDVNPLLPYLDRVLYIGRGQIAIGTPESVINSETLSHLYDSQIDVLHTKDGRLVVVGHPESVTYHPHLKHQEH